MLLSCFFVLVFRCLFASTVFDLDDFFSHLSHFMPETSNVRRVRTSDIILQRSPRAKFGCRAVVSCSHFHAPYFCMRHGSFTNSEKLVIPCNACPRFGIRLPCRFCPGFELCFHVFSRAPRASPRTVFLRTPLFVSRYFHTPPRSVGLGTTLRIYVIVRSKYFWHFQLFYPPCLPSIFTEERQT